MSFSRAIALIVVIGGLVAILVSAFDGNDSDRDNLTTASQTTEPTDPLEPIPVLGEVGTLSGLDGWLNTEATSLEDIRAESQLVVVQFWTLGCSNCKNTISALQDLYAAHKGDGLEIVGVHAPEFSYEADVGNIIDAAAKLGVDWPIALDTHKRNFHAWQEGPTAYWPRVYLIDQAGQIRYDKRGDGASTYETLAEYVERLLTDET